MINWFEKLFGNGDNIPCDENGLPYVKDIIPMPKVKPCKPEKDISEPVLSFVKCVRENPKRFIAESSETSHYFLNNTDIEDYRAYKIYDKVAKKGWYLLGKYYSNTWFVGGYPGEGGPLYNNPFFLTEDEKAYVLKEVKLVMNYRGERKVRLERIRKERRIRDERNRLKEIYK
jgi:hypothetical protein